MAKKAKAVTVNVALLQAIASGVTTRVTQAEATSLEGLIEVNIGDIENEKALARVSEAGTAYLSNLNSGKEKEKPMFGIIKGVVLPLSNRGNRKGAGAPTVYPFATMEVGDSFFVGNSEKADAAKKLQSTVSAQNHKYSEPTGETETVEVTKRGKGNKAVKDEQGNKVKETVTRPVRKAVRKYVLRPVVKGVAYGEWTAPEDGALIAREA